jgi:protocatechuate 3,4-dioxygenase beta subunit
MQNQSDGLTRRGLLAALVGVGGILLLPARAIARACRTAVAADEGPFYPVDPFPETDDLLGSEKPAGVVLYLLGRVLDPACKPLPGAVVEIWQCDAGGQYNHPRAPRVKALERDFKYFAKTRTAQDGAFSFRTLRPAPYTVGGIQRAPHIHIQVKAGRRTLTTEVYFEGQGDETLRERDGVFQSRGARKGELVVALKPAAVYARRLRAAPEAAALACEYDLTLS